MRGLSWILHFVQNDRSGGAVEFFRGLDLRGHGAAQQEIARRRETFADRGHPAGNVQGHGAVEHDGVNQPGGPAAGEDGLDRGEVGREITALQLGERRRAEAEILRPPHAAHAAQTADTAHVVDGRRGEFINALPRRDDTVADEARLLAEFVERAGDAISEEAPFGLRVGGRDMGYAVDGAGAQKLGGDPAGQPARAAIAAEWVLERMADIGGFEAADAVKDAKKPRAASGSAISRFISPILGREAKDGK